MSFDSVKEKTISRRLEGGQRQGETMDAVLVTRSPSPCLPTGCRTDYHSHTDTPEERASLFRSS